MLFDIRLVFQGRYSGLNGGEQGFWKVDLFAGYKG